MYELTIDFGRRELLISADIAIALDNPLEFNYLMNKEKGLFGITGEITSISDDAKCHNRPLQNTCIMNHWDEAEKKYRIAAGEVILNKISVFIPNSKRSNVYKFSGNMITEMHAVIFDLTKAVPCGAFHE